MLHKVVFLDRDGVINRDSPDHVKNLEEFEFIPGALAALRRLTEHGFTSIVITNQSALGRGLVSAETLQALHRHLCTRVSAIGGEILDIFICPHLPGAECLCRKPQPGLLYAAQRKYRIDFSSAFIIGDSSKDIECGRNAGIGHTILVQTGNGRIAARELFARRCGPDVIAEDLHGAVDWMVHNTESPGFRK